MYLQNLSRGELIAIIEDERQHNKRKRVVYDGDSGEDQEALIRSLRSQLEDSDRRNRDLQAIVRQLQVDLDAARRTRPDPPVILPPIFPRRARTSGSSMSGSVSSGFSSLNLTPIDTRTSLATTISQNDLESDLLSKLHDVNSALITTAHSLCKRIRYNHILVSVDRKTVEGIDGSFTRASWLLGDRVPQALFTQPLPKNAVDRDPPTLLTQIVFEAIFAKWAAFILGYADDTIDESGEHHIFVLSFPDCDCVSGTSDASAWQRTLRELESCPPNSEKWFASIMGCIHDVMVIAGWSFKKSDDRVPLTPVIGAIQTLRKALDDISSYSQDVSVHLPRPGSAFSSMPDVMVDAYAPAKRSIFGIKKRPSANDRIVATVGLGLLSLSRMERLAPRAPPLAPPKVVLERTFLDAFSSSPDLEEQAVRIRVGGGRSAAIAPVKVRVGG
ncbi:hypothetical protein FA13DRAFT_664260 [Coprinellus micaceus]|uniref:Uncharacterized protein n=1 Tax=Coprinellus micaceus TaxID=71717 RepID=A0A4Y7T5C6_COPMI|nr:hypothetical protein FA13DRAFT_664260 [Coprinellus micaceus]